MVNTTNEAATIMIKEVCEKHDITPQMFDKATPITWNGSSHEYIVESLFQPDVEYRVTYNPRFGVLLCTCKQVTGCWHTRAALAAEEHYEASRLAKRQAEQAEIEATPEYQLDQLFLELDEVFQKIDEIVKEADMRDARHEAVLQTLDAIVKTCDVLSA